MIQGTPSRQFPSRAELPSSHAILHRDRAGIPCLIARIQHARLRPLRGGVDGLTDGNGTRALRDSRRYIQTQVERGDSDVSGIRAQRQITAP